MSRKSHPLTAALESDFDAVVLATRCYLKKHNLFKDFYALEREQTQACLFEYIDQEIEIQRTIYMELLREFWILHFEATPYDELMVRGIVDEYLETKRRQARAIVARDLGRQEEHDRVRCERLPTRLKWRLNKVWSRVNHEWESSTALEAGLSTAAAIACLWYLAFFWWAPSSALPMIGFVIGTFAGIVVCFMRDIQIQNKRWQEWRAQIRKR